MSYRGAIEAWILEGMAANVAWHKAKDLNWKGCILGPNNWSTPRGNELQLPAIIGTFYEEKNAKALHLPYKA